MYRSIMTTEIANSLASSSCVAARPLVAEYVILEYLYFTNSDDRIAIPWCGGL